jgi:hypothetical protein
MRGSYQQEHPMKMPIRLSVLLWVAGVLSWASLVSAEVKRSDFDQEGGFHEFVDDDLLAGGTSPYGSWMKLRKPAVRVLLIRPRASFVSEMLKSVDNI